MKRPFQKMTTATVAIILAHAASSCQGFRSPQSKFIVHEQSQSGFRTLSWALLERKDDQIPVGFDDSILSDRQQGVLVLLTVPVAWGTFEPAVRLVYQIQPDIPAFLFSLAYYLVAAIPLCLFALAEERKNESFSKSTIQGGFELGTYLFVGNALQVIGLKTVPSDRAAFLLQLTTILVPLVQSILAKNLSIIPTKTWIACFVALAGIALIGMDGAADSITSLQTNHIAFAVGDFYIMLGALFYSFHCIRLEGYAKNSTSAIQLAAAKASTEALWASLVVFACIMTATSLQQPDVSPAIGYFQDAGNNLLDYYQNSLLKLSDSTDTSSLITLTGALLWTGLVTIAYTITAQTYGQSRVSPATANLIYTIQPFFTALIAFFVLGETLGIYGYAGGSLIAAAVLLVVTDGESVDAR